jgi:hypothetical protein
LQNLKELESPEAVFKIPDHNLVMVRTDNSLFSSYMQRSANFPAGGMLENVALPSGTMVTIYIFEAFGDIA